ncbi:MAG: hypothetical protein GY797_05085 [Deltaproteobacteria bacterium]|nr:hypothetical protein [Deltaproteobacteria bacterium]
MHKRKQSMSDVIGAQHKFHDEKFVVGWAERFTPTPERLELFNVMLSELKSHIPPNGCVVELGIGPGYLADYLLRAMHESNIIVSIFLFRCSILPSKG